MSKEFDIKTAIVVGPKFMKFLKDLAKLTGQDEREVLKRALSMYRTIKLEEKKGYRPCMLKGKTARLLQEG